MQIQRGFRGFPSKLIALAGAAAASMSTLAAPAAAGWTIVPTPSPGPASTLNAVAVLGASDAWAVGENSFYKPDDKMLVLHWNGSVWSQSTVPDSTSYDEALFDVTFVAANDGWAVGRTPKKLATAAILGALALHWNGSSWTKVTVPLTDCTSGCGVDALNGVVALASNNLWAVGKTRLNAPLLAHWNGSAWDLSAAPAGVGYRALADVAAVSATNIWAVGSQAPEATFVPLMLHYDGASWQEVVLPASPLSRQLQGIVALSATNIWVVGSSMAADGSQRPIILHLNGSTWQDSPVPAFTTNTFLNSVAAVSASDIWAVGRTEGSNGSGQTLTMHWNGTSWSVVASPNASPTVSNSLKNVGIHAASATIWAAGYGNGTTPTTLAMRFQP